MHRSIDPRFTDGSASGPVNVVAPCSSCAPVTAVARSERSAARSVPFQCLATAGRDSPCPREMAGSCGRCHRRPASASHGHRRPLPRNARSRLSSLSRSSVGPRNRDVISRPLGEIASFPERANEVALFLEISANRHARHVERLTELLDQTSPRSRTSSTICRCRLRELLFASMRTAIVLSGV
jgi:hypothetical protein